MISLLKRLRLEIEDGLRYHPQVRHLLCGYKKWRAPRPDPRDAQAVARAIVHWCAAARLAETEDAERPLQERIVDLVDQLDWSRLDWTEFVPDFRKPRLAKAAIVKPHVGPRESGVLYVSFEEQWIKLLRPANFRELAERYAVVLVPSSSPHNLCNYVFPRAYPNAIYSLISNAKDRAVLPRVSPRMVVVPLYASEWVNPDLFRPVPKSERSCDLLMVALWGKVKRHHAFFDALRSMPRDLRVLLIGQDQGGCTADHVLEIARWYGVQDRFTILSNQPFREVVKHLCQARASVVLSKREGSCVSVAESLFADTPAAILREAELGSRVFINDQTGCFLDGNHLARDLTEFVRNADRYQPRRWAEQNISCLRSSRILNETLKQDALRHGQQWTRDIAPLQWSPYPTVVDPEQRRLLHDEWLKIQQRYGLEIGHPPVQ